MKLNNRRYTFDDENCVFGPMMPHEYDQKLTWRDKVCRSISRRVGADVDLREYSMDKEGHDSLMATWHDKDGCVKQATVHAIVCCRLCQK